MLAAARGTPVRTSARPGASSMLELADLGVASIETLGFPVKARAGQTADDVWLAATARDLTALRTRLIRAQVTLVPLMAAARMRAYPDEVVRSPAFALLPEARQTALGAALKSISRTDVAKARRAWTSQAAFLKQFVRAGGRVAAGSGFEWRGYPPPGIGVHLELEALVAAGLSPEDAIRAATTHAAAMLGLPKEIGLVAQGLEANLLIVKGDPLARIEDLRKIATVIRAGEVFDAKDLAAQSRQAMRTASR
jgi:imidazolonepropionase-like amidohydrolase